VEETVNVDLEDLTRIFGENQHIEFEILKEAPKGTLILDNGSEITDAGIHTQLKMIENLGKGKFKNKPPESETDLEKADGEIKSEEG
jgi:DNA-binding NtrC family response regulator